MLLHAVAALAILGTTAFNHWLAIPGWLALGYFFEKTQHRYEYSYSNDRYMDNENPIIRTKTGWTGWITKHRLLEAAGWGMGGLVYAIGMEISPWTK